MSRTTIRFRFVLNQGLANKGGGQASSVSKAINGVVQNVAIRYADGTYEQVKQRVVNQLHKDIGTEMSWMIGLFKRSIIGIRESARGPNGSIGMANELSGYSKAIGIKRSHQASENIQWPERKKSYLDWKQSWFRQKKWFLGRGKTIGAQFGSKTQWEGAFGPMKVEIVRGKRNAIETTSIGQRGTLTVGSLNRNRTVFPSGAVRLGDADNMTTRVQVCNIRVAAFTRITPRMLPSLASGSIADFAPDGRTTGLIRKMPKDVAYRLGGKRGAKGVAGYRHTTEPFLSFFLTQAVPNALFARMEKGMGMKLQQSLSARERQGRVR